MTGKVWLVGAGPGDVGLLTLRGREVLENADVVVYDALVGQGILPLIPPAQDEAVGGVCGLLGLEPLYLACEGRLVMICAADQADALVEILRVSPHTEGAAVIGEITAEQKGRVVLTTQIGTQTFLPQPGNELLPRIC